MRRTSGFVVDGGGLVSALIRFAGTKIMKFTDCWLEMIACIAMHDPKGIQKLKQHRFCGMWLQAIKSFIQQNRAHTH
jgi:hypothetical protein